MWHTWLLAPLHGGILGRQFQPYRMCHVLSIQVLTDERISHLPAILRELSPALSPSALASTAQQLHLLATTDFLPRMLSSHQPYLTPARLQQYAQAVDAGLQPERVGRLLHVVGQLLSGGRLWEIRGVPQPQLHWLRDKEAAEHPEPSSSSSSSRGVKIRVESPSGWNVSPSWDAADADMSGIIDHYLPAAAAGVSLWNDGSSVSSSAGHHTSASFWDVEIPVEVAECVGDACLMCPLGAPPHQKAAAKTSSSSAAAAVGAADESSPVAGGWLMEPTAVAQLCMVTDEVLQPRRVQQVGSLMDHLLLPSRVDKAVAVLDKVLGLDEMSAAYQGPSCTLVAPAQQQQQQGIAVSGKQRVARQLKRLAAAGSAAAGTMLLLVMGSGKIPKVIAAAAAVAGSPVQQQKVMNAVDACLGLMAIWLHQEAAKGRGRFKRKQQQEVLREWWEHAQAGTDGLRLAGVVAAGLWGCWWSFHTNLVLQPGERRKQQK